jgi:hypothetical protein
MADNPQMLNKTDNIPMPSVGRIVHSKSELNVCLAAMVTAVNDSTSLELTVFVPRATPVPYRSVKQGAGVGEWHWPERT